MKIPSGEFFMTAVFNRLVCESLLLMLVFAEMGDLPIPQSKNVGYVATAATIYR
jgi:hypothetical protein